MDTNTCPACQRSLNTGGAAALAQPHVGNLRTGAFTPSGDRPAQVHVECVGKVGLGDVLWMAVDQPDPPA